MRARLTCRVRMSEPYSLHCGQLGEREEISHWIQAYLRIKQKIQRSRPDPLRDVVHVAAAHKEVRFSQREHGLLDIVELTIEHKEYE